MTIKKIGLSALAATLVATASIAGTISTTNGGKISSELLSFQDLNISDISGSATYTLTNIPAGSMKNPIFKFTFANAKNLVVVDANLSVLEVKDGNASNTAAGNYTLVAATPTISGSNSEVVSFNSISGSTYVYNNKIYVLRDTNATTALPDANTSISTAGLKGTVAKGSSSDVTLKGALYSGDSQALNDSTTPSSIFTITKEWSAIVKTTLNEQIDASSTFQKFYKPTVTGKDSLVVTVTRGTMIAAGKFTPTSIPWTTFSDTNLTVNSYSMDPVSAAGVITATPTANDYNVTADINVTAAGASTDSTITYNIAANAKILNKTTFDTQVTMTDGTNPFTLISRSAGNAGQWTIYGYNAQIPNVAATANVDVTMKFTNRSTNSDIFFTLVDPDGTVKTLSSVANSSIASLNKDTTGTYKASALLALITDPAFDKTGSFSVEVSIPTTPTSVYGMASFKNLSLGQFKDLPVYNNSTNSY